MDDPVAPAVDTPRRLGDWPSFFWSRVLFPGAFAPEGRTFQLISLAILVLAPALFLYPGRGFQLFEPDESRYAEIPREMLRRGDWVVPYLQGQPYLDKPPLFYWLTAAAFRLFGESIASARLIPALAVHGSILLVYLFGRRLVGERAAFWGAIGLLLAPGFVGMGRLLLLDGLLTLWATLALFAVFEAQRGTRLAWGWWLLGAAACGLGVLTKGPVALLLLGPPVWLYQRLSGRGVRVRWTELAVFVGVMAAVAAPWYVAVCLRLPEFARTFFWEHNVMRFLTPFAHERGVWFYGPVLLSGLLPATLLTPALLRFFGTADESTARRRSPELGFLILGGGWCLLFFTLSACKLPTYILPAFPFCALVFGYVFVESRWFGTRTAAVVVGLGFAATAATHYVALPWYAAYRSPLARTDDLVRLCSDPTVTVVCYPRECDSVAFFLGRDDLRAYRSKDIEELRGLVRSRPRTVILCTHRHSLKGLRQLLPPDVTIIESVHRGLAPIPGVPKRLAPLLAQMMGETALGLCDLAVVEPRPTNLPIPPADTGPDPTIFDWSEESGD